MRTFDYWVFSALIVFVLAFGVVHRGFCAFYGRKYLRLALALARRRKFSRAMRFTRIAANFQPMFRKWDALHAYYEAIQSDPPPAVLEDKIRALEVMLADRQPTRIETLWARPGFRYFIGLVGTLIFLFRLMALFSK